eukprot:Skav209113  [mRNA]  locus=scaffold179:241298:246030:+ [translate_table: standard]
MWLPQDGPHSVPTPEARKSGEALPELGEKETPDETDKKLIVDDCWAAGAVGHQVPLHQVPARCALPAGACNLGNSYMPPAIGGAAAPASYVPQPQGVAAPVRHHVPAVGHIQQGFF